MICKKSGYQVKNLWFLKHELNLPAIKFIIHSQKTNPLRSNDHEILKSGNLETSKSKNLEISKSQNLEISKSQNLKIYLKLLRYFIFKLLYWC